MFEGFIRTVIEILRITEFPYQRENTDSTNLNQKTIKASRKCSHLSTTSPSLLLQENIERGMFILL